MNFLFELIWDIVLGTILRFILLCFKIIVEAVFISFLWEGIRFFGVCFLYVVGKVLQVFSPHKMTYSFNAMWTMDYDKRDSYMMMIEASGQRIAGALMLGLVLAMCFAL